MIYFIESQGLVKIGFSLKPEKRTSKIQSDSPYPCRLIGVMDGSAADETAVQAKFAHLHLRAEWFKIADDLLSFISENAVVAVKKRRGEEPSDPIGKYLFRNSMTDRSLGKILGVSGAQVNRVRNGRSWPSKQLMLALFEKTGITPNELIGLEAPMPENWKAAA
ncbi:GIY-YIG nuclease family protein [Rhizobium hidalgonense]|uniref:GIY-YIG nuclease family protein n=1 Tax=Rhizobium hidalgonense TaxID=1538159 RepID=UPI00287280D6|nr:GIY-YIG nuclease family protein [Rhizobium hidalgonense]MDR9813082.1 GIY-YIG nuclease family protein [Rhizobium hidalgonense]